MTTRRAFLSLLAGLPVLGKMIGMAARDPLCGHTGKARTLVLISETDVGRVSDLVCECGMTVDSYIAPPRSWRG